MCTFNDDDVAQYLIIVEKGKSLSFVQVVYIGPIAYVLIDSESHSGSELLRRQQTSV